jgi:two-component system response regulator FlrC
MDDLKLQGIRARWIATCSHNPNEMVQNQKLRRDLFYRLSVIHLEVPALRQRPEDISILSQFFVQVFSLMKNGEARSLSVEAQAKLLSYSWPGNVCELENVIERAVAMTSESEISLDAIQFSQTSPHLLPTAGATLSEMERKLILQTLQVTQQNKTRAAQILGISIRTLRNKLHEYREAGVM